MPHFLTIALDVTSASSADPGRTLSLPFWRWLALLFVLLLVLAALRPLSVPDEGRYAEISRWMLVSSDWLVPRLDGLPFFHKPPLMHWLQASAMAAFGVTPWTARLVPASAALLMVCGLYLATQRLATAALARRAALMLAASGVFLIGGQYVNHDMLVAALIASTIWCFALSLLHGERPHALLARAGFVFGALGLLTKGLIGVALPGLVLLVWITWTRQWRKVARLPWVSGLLLFALLALPWFVLAGERYPGLWNYLFGVQQFGRYTGTVFNNRHGHWFYPAVLAVMLLPWTFFIPFSAPARKQSAPSATTTIASQVRSLCWIWLLAILVFFSIPASKLTGYILPVLPPLALLAALGWERVMAGRRHAERWFALLALIPVGGVLLLTVETNLNQRRLSLDVATTLAAERQAGEPVYACGGYPYDLPFVARLQQPVIVVQNWPSLRTSARDNWQRELFEAGDFEPDAARAILHKPGQLQAAAQHGGAWLVTPVNTSAPPGWKKVQQGRVWNLYTSGAKGPVTAQDESLPRCYGHGDEQGKP